MRTGRSGWAWWAVVTVLGLVLLGGYGCWYWWGYRQPRRIPDPFSPAAGGAPVHAVVIRSGQDGALLDLIMAPARAVDEAVLGTRFDHSSILIEVRFIELDEHEAPGISWEP